jgi:hypothetical protein
MKLRITKQWWQFWLPKYLDAELVNEQYSFKGIPVETRPDAPPGKLFMLNGEPEMREPRRTGTLTDPDEPSSIEANEAEPWYNAEPSDSDSVVTVEPDLVAKNRGNNAMKERQNGEM